jgi:nitrate reductase delta subunit
MMQILKIIALLIEYPDEVLWENREEAIALIAQDAPALLPFTQLYLNAPLLDRQAEWCEVFERGRATSLLLFEHVHEESRDRGQAMVDLMSQYEKVGLQLDCRELPDYLPLYLEYLSIVNETQAREGLQNVAPILALIGGRLKQRDVEHYQLFDALLRLAKTNLSSDSVTAQVATEKRDDTRQALDAVWEEEQVKFIEDNATSCDSSPMQLLSRLSATTQIAASNDREYNLQGQKASVSANYALTQNVSLRASASHATRDYRTLSDSLDSDFVAQNKNEYSAGVSLATGMTGSLGLSYYQADSYQNSNDSRYLALSWSKVFRRATLSVSWQHQLGTNGRMRYADGNGKDSNTANDKDLVYVNLSVPLGSNSANLYSRHDSNSTHFGAAMNANVSDELNYSVGAERGTKDNVNAVNGGINANLHYTQLSMNASADSDHNRTYSASLQGGIVAHGDGMTFSPWPINDTFAVAQLDSNISGVKIDTPQKAATALA